MTENACQTSLENQLSYLATKEIQKLKEENFILQGKIRGYATLGSLLREQKEECAKLKKMNEDLQDKVNSPPGAGSISQSGSSKVNHAIMNGDNGTKQKNPGEDKKQTIISENIDVSLKIGQSVNGLSETTSQNKNKNQDLIFDMSKSSSWTDQMSGVAYPPDDIFKHVKTDKYPTQESISLNSANDFKQKLQNSQKQPIAVVTNGNDKQESKSYRDVLRSSSTIVNVGSDSNSKSMNLMEFPSEHSDDELSSKTSTSNTKVVTAPSSQSSSFQVLKPGLSREGSKSETALSLQVSEIVNEDLGTDGPTSKMKKVLEDILPDLTKIEEENDRIKIENKRLFEENSRLLKKLQHLELQVNNVSPTESLSSQTQVVDWEHVSKSEFLKSTPVENEVNQKTDSTCTFRLHKLEEQNRELLEANSRWEKMFKEMRSDQENRTRVHQNEIENLRGQINKMKVEDEKRQREYDKILLTTKNRLEDVESAKDRLQADLTEFQTNCEQLKREKRELEESLNAVNREQLARDAELSVLRQGVGGNSIHAIHLSSESELRTEIAVLREQLTVFQEDFDRERQDRAKAQSEKDDLYNQLTKIRQDHNKLVDQNKRYLAQLQTAEVNVKEAIEESTRLNSSNLELRAKVRQLESQISSRPSSAFTPNIVPMRPSSQPSLMVQPETDPYARPSPPYLLQTALNSGNQQTNRERYPSEQQPGAWNCDDCTYSNHPSRSVCEMCGKFKTQGSSSIPVQHSSSPTLWRRGENGEQNDLATDCVR